ncbi:MAG: tail fiber domain-containing protein [Bacteroidia bacterium]|nr:tail fiber domain-containing protein [Bacteroidia bacterium]
MKNILFSIFATVITLTSVAQTPQSFQYQAVIRDASGNVLQSQSVNLRLSIIPVSAVGVAEYVETHTLTTNTFGIVSLSVGNGTVVTGNFSTINWGASNHFIKVEADLGSGYIDMGTTQLLSVPYAMYSQAAGNVDTLWNKSGNNIYNANNGNVGVGLNNPSGRMVIQGSSTALATDPLFEVKNSLGQTVFVVYQDSVNVFVNDDAIQSNRGGFAVSGRNNAKAITHNYLKVTPDKTRIFLNEDINNDGFAVMGINSGGIKDYLNVSVDTTEIIDPSKARILWYPTKEAFLTGRVLIENKDSVGVNSFASGFESKAIGMQSQALGYKTVARGNYATAIGYFATAKGPNTYALGNYAFAGDSASYAIGSGAKAQGLRCFAIGSSGVDSIGAPTNPTIASGNYSYAFGMGSIASGKGAFAFGTQDTALGWYSLAMGYQTKANNWYATTMGKLTKASGESSTAIGFNSTSSGKYASAIGANSVASGYSATAIGYNAKATGSYSVAIGRNNTASGGISTVLGELNTAAGLYSTAMGYINRAGGDYSTAFSRGTNAKPYASFVIGRYNDTTCSATGMTNWIATDPLFIIGIGATASSRTNAMTVLKNGETYLPAVYNSTVGTTNRDLFIDNTGKLGYVASSKRYKKDISDMENIDWLYQLRPVNYIYKNDNFNKKQFGLIAEEVEKINPLFVSYNYDGIVETVNYSNFISPLIKALQDQKKINDVQQIQINKLLQENEKFNSQASEINNLKAEIEKIKKFQAEK